jgi:hypothetical protein
MSNVSREAGAAFLLTLSPTSIRAAEDHPPWRVASFLREYEEDYRANGVPAVNCVREYFANGGNARYLRSNDAYHLNPEGNRLIAQTTWQWLKDEYPQTKLHAKGPAP